MNAADVMAATVADLVALIEAGPLHLGNELLGGCVGRNHSKNGVLFHGGLLVVCAPSKASRVPAPFRSENTGLRKGSDGAARRLAAKCHRPHQAVANVPQDT